MVEYENIKLDLFLRGFLQKHDLVTMKYMHVWLDLRQFVVVASGKGSPMYHLDVSQLF